jgi:hypothetical protein
MIKTGELVEDTAAALKDIEQRKAAWQSDWQTYLALRHNSRRLKPGLEKDRTEKALAERFKELMAQSDQILAYRKAATEQRHEERAFTLR